MQSTRYRAALVLTPAGAHRDWALTVQGDRITALGPAGAAVPGDVDLGDVALIPGLVDAHSHAFQRALRGRTQHLDAARPDADFWTWREAMYRVALRLDPDEVEALARLTFLELVEAGVTAVGEFHYLHHQPDGRPYADPNELAHRVIRAAQAVGLRIALLRVLYHRGGYQRPAGDAQRRFVESDVDTALARVEALAAAWVGTRGVSVGLAPHSVRAVPGEWLAAAGAHARATGRVLHVHACEQPAELAECRAEHGAEPVAVLESLGALGPTTTLVHATWLEDGAAGRIAAADALVCACATTERDLGD
ncbi:MAG: formimidoylglutamate deiminase, partial [Myxococcales bacterium]|nr:formimidoylglutamate deiminase [Myxococcales bacterium]